MKNKKIKLGMIGGGHGSFIGIMHRVAAYMGEEYDLVGGVFDADHTQSLDFAEQLELDTSRVYEDLDTLIDKENQLPGEDRMKAIVIVTPNFLHYSMAKKLIMANFHIICEKPVTTSLAEAVELGELVKKHNVVFSLTHTYTGYPMVRQMRTMIQEGVIGDIQRVDAQYYQGWINPVIHEKEKRATVWRLDPSKAGISCCMGDIGVHAFNLVEYTTGLKVKRLLSDLNTLYDDNPLDVDGTVLLRLDNDIRGIVRASQIATAEENNIHLAVYGRKGGLRWAQENPNCLYYLEENKPMQILKPGNPYTSDFALQSTKIAPGHPEGLFDAMGNIYKGTAQAIRGESYMPGAFPTIRDGVRGMNFIEKVVASSQQGNVWVDL